MFIFIDDNDDVVNDEMYTLRKMAFYLYYYEVSYLFCKIMDIILI